ncbi:hypothetical protein SAMD00079811_15940 [Scytonema sp. HK-05]|nr:hypothetical protein SAMD00079811_15940 [Scytonema sp. HK-05]
MFYRQVRGFRIEEEVRILNSDFFLTCWKSLNTRSYQVRLNTYHDSKNPTPVKLRFTSPPRKRGGD